MFSLRLLSSNNKSPFRLKETIKWRRNSLSNEPFDASESRRATIEKLRAKCTCANFSLFTVVLGQHRRGSLLAKNFPVG